MNQYPILPVHLAMQQAVGIRVMYVGGNPGYIRHKYKMGWITRVSTTEVTLRYSARDGGGEQVFQGAIPSEFLLLDDGPCVDIGFIYD
jgi:hypothetical protein